MHSIFHNAVKLHRKRDTFLLSLDKALQLINMLHFDSCTYHYGLSSEGAKGVQIKYQGHDGSVSHWTFAVS